MAKTTGILAPAGASSSGRKYWRKPGSRSNSLRRLPIRRDPREVAAMPEYKASISIWLLDEQRLYKVPVNIVGLTPAVMHKIGVHPYCEEATNVYGESISVKCISSGEKVRLKFETVQHIFSSANIAAIRESDLRTLHFLTQGSSTIITLDTKKKVKKESPVQAGMRLFAKKINDAAARASEVTEQKAVKKVEASSRDVEYDSGDDTDTSMASTESQLFWSSVPCRAPVVTGRTLREYMRKRDGHYPTSDEMRDETHRRPQK